MNILLEVLQYLLAAAMLLPLTRLLRGPRLIDRVVAIDLLASLSVGFIVIRAEATRVWLLLDIALGLGLISAIGTIAIGAFIEQHSSEAREEKS